MSMRPQAHDIIRTWAFDTIVKVWMHNDTIPWESIVISGHVLSDSGGKLSKSKDGGKLTPEGLLTQYPADAIRFWTASEIGRASCRERAETEAGVGAVKSNDLR